MEKLNLSISCRKRVEKWQTKNNLGEGICGIMEEKRLKIAKRDAVKKALS